MELENHLLKLNTADCLTTLSSSPLDGLLYTFKDLTMSKWNDLDNLPTHSHNVLVTTIDNNGTLRVDIAFLSRRNPVAFATKHPFVTVTHWQELPTPAQLERI